MAEMNLVTIIFNPDKFTELKKALNEIGVTGMTVTHVEGCGVQHGQKTSVGYCCLHYQQGFSLCW